MLKRAGYKGEYAVFLYIFFQFIFPLAVSVFVVFYRSVAVSIAIFLLLIFNVFYLVYKKGKRISKQLEKSVYRIYKYLYNQISAGVKVTDAIKSVYEVIENKELKEILIRFAARYDLTLNIDDSLKDFCSYFNTIESETLAVAIKQGVETGKNHNILVQQEEVMFEKYLNYIQVETENAKKKANWSMIFFMLIIVIMMLVPMAQEAKEGFRQIFLY